MKDGDEDWQKEKESNRTSLKMPLMSSLRKIESRHLVIEFSKV